jgi:propanol-preferring alcohol dehydrogenase
VDALGSGVSGFAPGDRVGVAWLRGTCGRCEYCLRGAENLCPDSRYTGYHANGGYAELAVVPEGFAYPIPDGFDDLQAAPLLCAGIIGYRALQRAEVPPGGRLALYGFGSSASVVIQIALHRGYEVHVVSRGDSHRQLAREMGALWVGAPGEGLPVEVDSAIIFAPAGDIVPDALASVRKGGTVAMAGIYMTPVPELDYEAHLFHEKNLRSVEANTREDGRGLLREAAEVPVRARVTTFPLREANEALIRLKNDDIDGSAVLVVD